jgi:hypothetical protein
MLSTSGLQKQDRRMLCAETLQENQENIQGLRDFCCRRKWIPESLHKEPIEQWISMDYL